MKLTVLGSGGSEGIPVPYCQCRVCKSGDKRLRSSYHLKISDKSELMIEVGPDFRIQQLKYGFNFTHCLLSHAHFDHVGGLCELRQAFIVGDPNYGKVTKNVMQKNSVNLKKQFILDQKLHDILTEVIEKPILQETYKHAYLDLLNKGIFEENILKPGTFHKIADFEMAIFYNHYGSILSDVGFVLSHKNKIVIYLADMGILNKATEDFINELKPDLVIAHTSFFISSKEGGHIGVSGLNGISHGEKILINHFSHKCNRTQKEMVQEAKKICPNLIVGYDGLVIDI
ncbi:MAG: hypothetical protein Q7J55_01175 [bacterium]|nr:hypothetical protein [bacterium]